MPNFDLKPHYFDLVRNLKKLCDKRIAAAQIDFPLTHDEVQDVFIPRDTLGLIQELTYKHKFNTVSRYDTVYFRPELRDAISHLPIVEVHGLPGWYLKNETDKWGMRTTVFTADLSVFSDEKQIATVNWVNTNVTECRQKDLVGIIVDSYLDTIRPTLWHVVSQWNTLTLGFDHDLKERAREKPIRKTRYRWDYNDITQVWYDKNKKYIEFIDQVLLGAQVLPDVKPERAGTFDVKASIYKYTKRAGELV